MQAYKFPVHIDVTTRAFWTQSARLAGSGLREAMIAIAAKPKDVLAKRLLSRAPLYNSTLRTTCVATLISGGRAQNVRPQRATANVNCRIFHSETIEGVRQRLVDVIGDGAIIVTARPRRGPVGRPAPLSPQTIEPAKRLTEEMFTGLPLVSNMSTGASDSIYVAAAGIPSYGIAGISTRPTVAAFTA